MSDRLAYALHNDSNGAYRPGYTYKAVKGAHPALNTWDEVFSGMSTEDWLQSWMCARCEGRVFLDSHGYRKQRGRAAWLHLGTAVPWCKSDKQHGPKTRYVFPVPSLHVIEELYGD